MAFAILNTMSEGFERTVQRNGLVLVAVLAVLTVMNTLLASTAMEPAGTADPTVGVLGFVMGLLSFVVAIASVVTMIVALRVFASGETEHIPRAFVRRTIGLATLNVIVGGVVFAVIVTLGGVLLVIPGLFLLVSLYYWSVFVAVEDQNFVRAFRSSWSLTRGSRLRLFGLGVAVVGLLVVVTALVSIPAAPFGIVGAIVTQTVGAALTMYALATTVSAYDQLRTLDQPDRPDTQPDMPGTPA
ncbi:hypothetical protein [Saliphagus infecundisoli]|uniref:DUF7847 domain-containing protein n=1 Tax=Saliphagus infecundisoli TaxID=1849069 RepID=A0ABD5QJ63_9EURY|nr:hypothetical protein [Saliphagus infecundisoli]